MRGHDVYMVNISNQHALIMEDFKVGGFGCCLGLRCSYLNKVHVLETLAHQTLLLWLNAIFVSN